MPKKDIAQKIASMESRMDKLEKALATVLPKRMLNTEEAATFLGMTVGGLHGLTHRKAIPFYKPTGKRLYFDLDELVAWQKKNQVKPKGEHQPRKMSPADVKRPVDAPKELIFEYSGAKS